jgi:hypothetical protein
MLICQCTGRLALKEKDTKEYFLKHKNDDIALFSVNSATWDINHVELHDSPFSPVKKWDNPVDTVMAFNRWINNRCIPNSREGIDRLKDEYHIHDIKELLTAGYGLSLSDHYWICPLKTGVKWEDINYFDNPYSENLGKIFFDRHFAKSPGDYESPDPALNGALRKRWKFEQAGKKSYLIKAGTSPFRQEPFNEVFVSMVLEDMGIDHVPYGCEKNDNEWVSICPCIIDKNTEMVSAMDAIRKEGLTDTYKDYADLCEKRGLTHIVDDLDTMIFIDYLVGNTDRHWNNFGVIRDAGTGTWLKTIPLFDHGASLWNNGIIDYSAKTHRSFSGKTNEDNLTLLAGKKIPGASDPVRITGLFARAFDNYGQGERKAELGKALDKKLALACRMSRPGI